MSKRTPTSKRMVSKKGTPPAKKKINVIKHFEPKSYIDTSSSLRVNSRNDSQVLPEINWFYDPTLLVCTSEHASNLVGEIKQVLKSTPPKRVKKKSPSTLSDLRPKSNPRPITRTKELKKTKSNIKTTKPKTKSKTRPKSKTRKQRPKSNSLKSDQSPDLSQDTSPRQSTFDSEVYSSRSTSRSNVPKISKTIRKKSPKPKKTMRKTKPKGLMNRSAPPSALGLKKKRSTDKSKTTTRTTTSTSSISSKKSKRPKTQCNDPSKNVLCCCGSREKIISEISVKPKNLYSGDGDDSAYVEGLKDEIYTNSTKRMKDFTNSEAYQKLQEEIKSGILDKTGSTEKHVAKLISEIFEYRNATGKSVEFLHCSAGGPEVESVDQFQSRKTWSSSSLSNEKDITPRSSSSKYRKETTDESKPDVRKLSTGVKKPGSEVRNLYDNKYKCTCETESYSDWETKGEVDEDVIISKIQEANNLIDKVNDTLENIRKTGFKKSLSRSSRTPIKDESILTHTETVQTSVLCCCFNYGEEAFDALRASQSIKPTDVRVLPTCACVTSVKEVTRKSSSRTPSVKEVTKRSSSKSPSFVPSTEVTKRSSSKMQVAKRSSSKSASFAPSVNEVAKRSSSKTASIAPSVNEVARRSSSKSASFAPSVNEMTKKPSSKTSSLKISIDEVTRKSSSNGPSLAPSVREIMSLTVRKTVDEAPDMLDEATTDSNAMTSVRYTDDATSTSGSDDEIVRGAMDEERPRTRRSNKTSTGSTTKFATEPQDYEIDFDEQDISSNEVLKSKLNTISEQSESGSSSPYTSLYQKTKTDSLYLLCPHTSTNKVKCLANEMSENRTAKPGQMCVQQLPPVIIPRGMVPQKSLHIYINPNGHSVNLLEKRESNIRYEEQLERNYDPRMTPNHLLACQQYAKKMSRLSTRFYGDLAGEESQNFTPRSTSSIKGRSSSRLKSRSGSGIPTDDLMVIKSYQGMDDMEEPYDIDPYSSESLQKLHKFDPMRNSAYIVNDRKSTSPCCLPTCKKAASRTSSVRIRSKSDSDLSKKDSSERVSMKHAYKSTDDRIHAYEKDLQDEESRHKISPALKMLEIGFLKSKCIQCNMCSSGVRLNELQGKYESHSLTRDGMTDAQEMMQMSPSKNHQKFPIGNDFIVSVTLEDSTTTSGSRRTSRGQNTDDISIDLEIKVVEDGSKARKTKDMSTSVSVKPEHTRAHKDAQTAMSVSEIHERNIEFENPISDDDAKSTKKRNIFCCYPHLVEYNLLAKERLPHKFLRRPGLGQYKRADSPHSQSTHESMSEGEIRCKCKTSYGEVHNCQTGKYQIKQFPRAYNIMDAKVKIEQHRTYFNNWVTYYIRKSEPNSPNFHRSSSSSGNK